MTNKFISTSTLICSILLFIIMLEWLYMSYARKQLLATMQTKSVPPSANEMPRIVLNQQAETNYADLINRPLFVAGRRPIVIDQHSQQVTLPSDLNWSLSGIYSSPKGWIALLVRNHNEQTENATENSTEHYRRVRVNDEIDGWQVSSIHKDKIRLSREDMDKELFLRKTKKPTPQAQQINHLMTLGTGRNSRMRPDSSKHNK